MKAILGRTGIGCMLAGVTVMAQPGEWSVSTGVLNRQIDTSFTFPTPNVSVMGLVNRRGDRTRGPLPLYSYDLEGTVQQFNEGTLGPDTYDDGDVDALYDMGALTLTDRSYLLDGGGMNEGPIRRGFARVHRLNLTTDGGTSYDYSSSGAWSDASAGDTVNTTGGFVEGRYGLNVLGQGWLNLLTGVRMVEADSGAQRSHGLITVNERRTDFTHRYGYDVVQFPWKTGLSRTEGINSRRSRVPISATLMPMYFAFDTPEEYAIFDAATAAGSEFYSVFSEQGNPFLDPSRSTDRRSRTRVVDVLEARSGADLDVSLQELVFAVEWAIEFAGQGRFAWSAGPTVNIIQADLDAWQGVYGQGGTPLFMQSWEDSGTHVRGGFMSQATFTWIFVPEGRTFVEGYGGYRFVDTLDLNAGPVGASIDASSYEAGVGFGVRL